MRPPRCAWPPRCYQSGSGFSAPATPGTLATRQNIAHWAAPLAAASQDAQAIEALSRAVTVNDLHGAETAEAATGLRNLTELQQRNGLDQEALTAHRSSTAGSVGCLGGGAGE
jgi:ferric-dicitrate binding protein FerR (iron transport regulator)